MLSGVTPRSRIMLAPSHRQTGQTTAQVTPTGYPFTTDFLLPMVPPFGRMRTVCVCIALIALVFASPAIAEQGNLGERLTPEVMAVVYPGAERLGMEEG